MTEEPTTAAVEEPTTAAVEESTTATVEEPGTATVKGKRIQIGRILLIVVLALVVILLAGFALRNYIPMAWLERVRFGSVSLPTLVAQVSQTQMNASPMAPVNTLPASMNMPGMDNASMATETAVAPVPAATQAGGVVTVITMTPTANVPATSTPTRTTETTAMQAATVTQQPTSTLPAAAAAPTITPDPSGSGQISGPEKIKTDVQDLYRLLQASQATMQTLGHGQLTSVELAAMRAQLTVVDQRMEKLVTLLRTGQPGLEPLRPEAQISSEHLSQLISIMRQGLGMVQTVLSGTSIDPATFAQAQGLVDQLQGMMGQIQSLVLPAINETQLNGVTATLTPTIMPITSVTVVPTTTPNPVIVINGELGELQAMLSKMEEMLRQMQVMLEQMRNQPGANADQSMLPGSNNLLIGTQTPVATPTTMVTAP